MFGFGKKSKAHEVNIGTSAPVRAGTYEAPTLAHGISLVHSLRGHKGYVSRIAWSPDGHFVATPSNDNTVRLWAADTGACSAELKGHKGAVHSAAFDPKGTILATTGGDKTVRLWDTRTGRLLQTATSQQSVFGVAFEPSGKFLVTAGEGVIHLRDAASGRLQDTLRGPRGTAFMGCWPAFHPQGQVLACGASNLMLFELPSCRLLQELDEHDGSPINSVMFAPQSNIVLTTSSDRSLKLCDSLTGQMLHSFEGHTGESYCAAFSSDGALIASKGGDSLRLWKYPTGESVTVPFANFGTWFPGLSFHPSKPLLAVVGSDPGVPKRDERADSVVFILRLDTKGLFG